MTKNMLISPNNFKNRQTLGAALAEQTLLPPALPPDPNISRPRLYILLSASVPQSTDSFGVNQKN